MIELRLSVILLSLDGGWNLRKALRHLADDRMAAAMEVLLAVPSGQALRIPLPDRFGAFRVVESEDFSSLGRARAAAVRAASTPAVFFTEDHSFPGPDWTEPLLARVGEGFADAGPEVRNANPRTRVSWADAMICYGDYFEPTRSGAARGIAWHNSAYRRDVLLELGDQLPLLLEADSALQQAILARGQRLALEPSAFTLHCNISRPSSHVLALFWGNRLYGLTRALAERWTLPRRLLYAAAWPLIAAMQFKRAAGHCLRLRRSAVPRLPVLAILILSALAAATGEVAGYLLGAGQTLTRRLHIELNRKPHLVPGDHAVIEG